MTSAREGRHPAPAVEPCVPADVIDVQVGADHEIHRLGWHTGGAEVVEKRRVQHVKRWVAAPVLVVADAGVHEHGHAGRSDDEAVHALQESSPLIEEMGSQPHAMRLDGLRRRIGQEPRRPRRSRALHHRRDAEPAHRKRKHDATLRNTTSTRQGHDQTLVICTRTRRIQWCTEVGLGASCEPDEARGRPHARRTFCMSSVAGARATKYGDADCPQSPRGLQMRGPDDRVGLPTAKRRSRHARAEREDDPWHRRTRSPMWRSF